MSGDGSTVSGFCFCGEVRFQVDVEADLGMRVFCHCESCRRAHAAPLYQVVYVKKKSFRITNGADSIKEFSKDPGRKPMRCFCSVCGSKIMNYLPNKPEVVGFFPSLLEEEVQHALPAAFVPLRHVNCGEAVLDLSCINDGLLHRMD